MSVALEASTRWVERSGFAELAAGAFWKPDERIAMLWAYFDESGDHDPASGALLGLTIGGLIAPLEVWQAFDEEWGAALKAQGLSYFHRRQFSSDRLDEFLRIVCRHIGLAFGFTSTAVGDTGEAYETAFVDCLLHCANASAKVDEISVTFARHPEFSGFRGERYRDLVNWRDARLARIGFDDPKKLRPLQAVDLVAHALRGDVKRLQELGCKVFRYREGRPVS